MTKAMRGEFIAMIIDSDITKLKNGRYVDFTWLITERNFLATKIKQRIPLHHPKYVVQVIGQNMLWMICDAVGHKGPLMDTEQLHQKLCRIRVSPTKQLRPEIKSAKPLFDRPARRRTKGRKARR